MPSEEARLHKMLWQVPRTKIKALPYGTAVEMSLRLERVNQNLGRERKLSKRGLICSETPLNGLNFSLRKDVFRCVAPNVYPMLAMSKSG